MYKQILVATTNLLTSARAPRAPLRGAWGASSLSLLTNLRFRLRLVRREVRRERLVRSFASVVAELLFLQICT